MKDKDIEKILAAQDDADTKQGAAMVKQKRGDEDADAAQAEYERADARRRSLESEYNLGVLAQSAAQQDQRKK